MREKTIQNLRKAAEISENISCLMAKVQDAKLALYAITYKESSIKDEVDDAFDYNDDDSYTNLSCYLSNKADDMEDMEE